MTAPHEQTPAQLAAEALARAEAATGGPWPVDDETGKAVRIPFRTRFTALAFGGTAENATFIAHARTDVPTLARMVQAVLAKADEMERVAATVATDVVANIALMTAAVGIRRALNDAMTEKEA